MRTFFKTQMDKNRLSILAIAWFSVVWFGVVFFWWGVPETFPLKGASGLLDGWISRPLFWFSAGYAMFLSVPKLYDAPSLYIGAGIFWTSAFCLSFYVANSADIFPFLVGSSLFYEANRLTRLSFKSSSQI